MYTSYCILYNLPYLYGSEGDICTRFYFATFRGFDENLAFEGVTFFLISGQIGNDYDFVELNTLLRVRSASPE